MLINPYIFVKTIKFQPTIWHHPKRPFSRSFSTKTAVSKQFETAV